MLMGLDAPAAGIDDPLERKIAMKMSKSRPNSAIFMTDSESDISKKIRAAYCPEKQAEENPILEYNKFILFESFKEIKIERPSKFGGDVVYASYDDMEKDYIAGKLFPLDLKNATAFHINKLLEPVRKHFESGKAKELAEKIKSFQVTR